MTVIKHFGDKLPHWGLNIWGHIVKGVQFSQLALLLGLYYLRARLFKGAQA
jgi:hypothetical protein